MLAPAATSALRREYGEWEKFTNWEYGTRVPLVVVAPWLSGTAGMRVSNITQLVDVFPSMAELAGVPVNASEGLDGVSFASVLTQQPASSPLPPWALSVYPRCPANVANSSQWWHANDCMTVERTAFPFMGVSLRTDGLRYTEWFRWNSTALAPVWDGNGTVAVELYDHTGDDGTTFDGPWEVVNLADNPSYAAARAAMAKLLRTVYPPGSAWPPAVGASPSHPQ